METLQIQAKEIAVNVVHAMDNRNESRSTYVREDPVNQEFGQLHSQSPQCAGSNSEAGGHAGMSERQAYMANVRTGMGAFVGNPLSPALHGYPADHVTTYEAYPKHSTSFSPLKNDAARKMCSESSLRSSHKGASSQHQRNRQASSVLQTLHEPEVAVTEPLLRCAGKGKQLAGKLSAARKSTLVSRKANLRSEGVDIGVSLKKAKLGKYEVRSSRLWSENVLPNCKEEDKKAIRYICDSSLPASEVVSYRGHTLVRENLQTLQPPEWIDAEVLSMWVLMLVAAQRLKPSCMKITWYLPSRFTQECLLAPTQLHKWAEKHRLHDQYLYDMRRCEKVFIIMHDSSPGHWYLLYLEMLQEVGEIWDTQIDADRKEKRKSDCVSVLGFLDELLKGEIQQLYPKGFSFAGFKVRHKPRVPKQPNGHDCGPFVMKFMANPAAVNEPVIMHNGSEDRMRFLMDIFKWELNEVRDDVYTNARSR